jgi:hypothetical protein
MTRSEEISSSKRVSKVKKVPKKSHPAKVHKIVGTWGRADDVPHGGHAYHCFSYRELWIQEGCPSTFEAWLEAKGVIAQTTGR